MKLKPEKFERLVNDKKALESALEKTRDNYRPYDPGQYLYRILYEKNREPMLDVFSDDYLELVYSTLIAWNMNQRGASLNGFDEFKESIKKSRGGISSLRRYRIDYLDKDDVKDVLDVADSLFCDLDLVGISSLTRKKIRSKLVAFSKTMHFMLPDLIVPIDRTYTLNFFYNNSQLHTDHDPEKNDRNQIKTFNELYDKFWQLSQKHDLGQYLDDKWNRNVPKVIDNAIIGSELKD